MLVLSRRVDERIFVGRDVIITVTEIYRHGRSPRVRLGIQAPPGVPIFREELLARLNEPRREEES